MRLIATAVLAVCLTAIAAFATEDTEKARALLEQVATAYQNAPTLTDTLNLELDGEVNTMRLRFDRDNKRVQFDVPGYAVMAIDGYLLVTSEAAPEKYMKAKIEGTLTETLVSTFGSPESVPFHFVMRDKRGIDAYLNSLTLGFLINPTITGFTPAGSDDNDHHVISLSDWHSKSFVHVDPKTNLIKMVRTELPESEEMGMEAMVATITTNPVVADELSDPIEFDPGDRTAVDSPDELVPQMIEVGDAAPEFSLPTLRGEKVSLTDLRGNIVVLDFWATWCIPCIRALPDVEKFAEWAKEEGHPVKVYAVNVWEQGDTLEERTEVVSDFWKSHGFKLENLMDYDDSLIGELAIGSIPTTVVIDGEGKIHEIHVGYSPRMFDVLKQIVTNAIEAAQTGE